MDILIFDCVVQETKESNGKQKLNFHEHMQNIPFGQITGSRAREPVNNDVGHEKIGGAMKVTKEQLIDFLERKVLMPVENHPEATDIIKRKIRGTRMRLNNLQSAEKVEEFSGVQWLLKEE